MANRAGDLTWLYRKPPTPTILPAPASGSRRAWVRSEEGLSGGPSDGPKRAAILMLALGEQYGGKVWSLLDDDEVRELSMVMSTLGTVEADVVEDLLLEFVSRMSASGALMGTFDGTERLLQLYLPADRVTGIMDEIRGPA